MLFVLWVIAIVLLIGFFGPFGLVIVALLALASFGTAIANLFFDKNSDEKEAANKETTRKEQAIKEPALKELAIKERAINEKKNELPSKSFSDIWSDFKTGVNASITPNNANAESLKDYIDRHKREAAAEKVIEDIEVKKIMDESGVSKNKARVVYLKARQEYLEAEFKKKYED
jgi:hypothetical protein